MAKSGHGDNRRRFIRRRFLYLLGETLEDIFVSAWGPELCPRVRSNTHSAKCSMTSTKDGVKGDLLKSWNTQVNIGQ